MRLLIGLALVVFFCASNAGADCKSDCQENYFNAMEECKTTYSDPELKGHLCYSSRHY